MRLPFRDWVLGQNLDDESLSLFEEAFSCFFARAYRASLLFSYLGLLRVLARRLLTADRPGEVPEKDWDRLQAGLRNEERWEQTVLEASVKQQPYSYFLADDDVRRQMHYWRDRRNDAAHSKANAIDHVHVESLWLFIRSNLPRLVVNGGREALLERFRRHFDPDYTPPGKPINPLVDQIPEVLRPAELVSFLAALFDLVGLPNDGEESVKWGQPLRPKSSNLLNALTALERDEVHEALAEYLEKDQEKKREEGPEKDSSILVAVLWAYPSVLLSYATRPDLVRQLWRRILPFASDRELPVEFGGRVRLSLRTIAAMLRHGLVKEDEWPEVMEHLLDRLNCERLSDFYPEYGMIEDDLLDELEPFGFLEAVYRRVFEVPDGRKWLYANWDLLLAYIERRPMDERVTRWYLSLFEPEKRNAPAQFSRKEEWDYWFAASSPSPANKPEDSGHFLLPFEDEAKVQELLAVARRLGLPTGGFEEDLRNWKKKFWERS